MQPPAIRRRIFAHFAAAIGPFAVRSYESCGAHFAAAMLVDGRERSWRAWMQLDERPPHRIRAAIPALLPPEGITLRQARLEDASALRALERRCQLAIGDVRITYDRGEDFFAGARLIGDAYPSVAERDGRLVAMHGMVTHSLRVGGMPVVATYLHHSRVLPEMQGAGLFSALNAAELERHARDTETFYSYVAVGNEAGLKIVPVPPWSVRPERVVIDTKRNAGPAHGRTAERGDAERIIELINAAHGDEELFVPYTRARLEARLGREPTAYGFAHVTMGEHAAIGIWPAGLRIRRDAPDGCERSVRALVVDTGFVPGAAEDELVALVRASCARLAEHGFTQLVLFTSPGSPGRDALHTLATRVEPYYLNIGLPEPPDAAQRGVYVDHLYF